MSDDDRTPGEGRGRRVVLITLVVAVAVYALFTWVFPWVTELGLSPTLDA